MKSLYQFIYDGITYHLKENTSQFFIVDDMGIVLNATDPFMSEPSEVECIEYIIYERRDPDSDTITA
jgi:hypothetical protein